MTDSIPLCFSTQVWFYCTAMFGSLPCWKMKFLAKRGFQDRKANAAQTMRRPLQCLTDGCRHSLLYLWPDVRPATSLTFTFLTSTCCLSAVEDCFGLPLPSSTWQVFLNLQDTLHTMLRCTKQSPNSSLGIALLAQKLLFYVCLQLYHLWHRYKTTDAFL